MRILTGSREGMFHGTGGAPANARPSPVAVRFGPHLPGTLFAGAKRSPRGRVQGGLAGARVAGLSDERRCTFRRAHRRYPCPGRIRTVGLVSRFAALHNPDEMRGADFIDRVFEIGRERNIPVRTDSKRGKGSQITLYFGVRKTIVKDRRKQVRPGLLSAMIRQLGLRRDDFR